MESERWALAEARVAELQTEHAAAISALEARHSALLGSLESRHLSEVQAMREEHRRALEQLRADLEKQLQEKEASHPTPLTQALEKHPLSHSQELPPVEGGLRTQTSSGHLEGVKAPVPPEVQGAQQVRRASGPACLYPVCPICRYLWQRGFLAGGCVVGGWRRVQATCWGDGRSAHSLVCRGGSPPPASVVSLLHVGPTLCTPGAPSDPGAQLCRPPPQHTLTVSRLPSRGCHVPGLLSPGLLVCSRPQQAFPRLLGAEPTSL